MAARVPKRFFNRREAAKAVGCAPETLMRYEAAGRLIPAGRTSHGVVYERSHIEKARRIFESNTNKKR